MGGGPTGSVPQAKPEELPTPPVDPESYHGLPTQFRRELERSGRELAGMSNEDYVKLAISMLPLGGGKFSGEPGAVPFKTWKSWKQVGTSEAGGQIMKDPAGNHYETLGSHQVTGDNPSSHVIVKPVPSETEKIDLLKQQGPPGIQNYLQANPDIKNMDDLLTKWEKTPLPGESGSRLTEAQKSLSTKSETPKEFDYERADKILDMVGWSIPALTLGGAGAAIYSGLKGYFSQPTPTPTPSPEPAPEGYQAGTADVAGMAGFPAGASTGKGIRQMFLEEPMADLKVPGYGATPAGRSGIDVGREQDLMSGLVGAFQRYFGRSGPTPMDEETRRWFEAHPEMLRRVSPAPTRPMLEMSPYTPQRQMIPEIPLPRMIPRFLLDEEQGLPEYKNTLVKGKPRTYNPEWTKVAQRHIEMSDAIGG